MSVQKALKHLAKVDPVMKRIIPHAGEITLTQTDDYFKCLVNSIISQLVSTKAADTVSARLDAYVGGWMDPATLAQIDTETYRTFGIGPQKSGYIRNVAQAFLAEEARYNALHELEDHEVIKSLTAIKGVGKWTAEMFLIFGLGRLDVFAPDDLILRQMTIKHYALGENTTRRELVGHAEKWAPYRSVASILLWRSLRM